VNVSANKNK